MSLKHWTFMYSVYTVKTPARFVFLACQVSKELRTSSEMKRWGLTGHGHQGTPGPSDRLFPLQFPVLTARTRAIFLKAPSQLSAATAAALQFPSLTDGRRVGRGAAVVNVRRAGCLVYMIYGTKIASVRCNFTHQLRLRLNQNRGSEKHDEREQKSAFQCSKTNTKQVDEGAGPPGAVSGVCM